MWKMSSTFAILLLLPLILPAIIAIIFLVLILRKRGGAFLREPCCEGCGYPRHGLETNRCPECGHAWGDATYQSTSNKETTMILIALVGLPLVLIGAVLLWLLAI